MKMQYLQLSTRSVSATSNLSPFGYPTTFYPSCTTTTHRKLFEVFGYLQVAKNYSASLLIQLCHGSGDPNNYTSKSLCRSRIWEILSYVSVGWAEVGSGVQLCSSHNDSSQHNNPFNSSYIHNTSHHHDRLNFCYFHKQRHLPAL